MYEHICASQKAPRHELNNVLWRWSKRSKGMPATFVAANNNEYLPLPCRGTRIARHLTWRTPPVQQGRLRRRDAGTPSPRLAAAWPPRAASRATRCHRARGRRRPRKPRALGPLGRLPPRRGGPRSGRGNTEAAPPSCPRKPRRACPSGAWGRRPARTRTARGPAACPHRRRTSHLPHPRSVLRRRSPLAARHRPLRGLRAAGGVRPC